MGFPNAGKSSLLRAISNARPAVAAYPFTTLNPHVGIVKYRDHEQVAGSWFLANDFIIYLQSFDRILLWIIFSFFFHRNVYVPLLPLLCVVADIPGIIRGAHLNRGLGISFLRHIERCRFLLFVLDLSTPDPWTQLQHLHYELDQYEPGLSQRPQAIIANKMDLPEARNKVETLKSLVTQRVIPVSALTGQNTEELILHLRELYDGYLQGEGSGGGKTTRW